MVGNNEDAWSINAPIPFENGKSVEFGAGIPAVDACVLSVPLLIRTGQRWRFRAGRAASRWGFTALTETQGAVVALLMYRDPVLV